MLPRIRILLLAAIGSLVQADGTAPSVEPGVVSPFYNFYSVARSVSGAQLDEATGGQNPHHNASDGYSMAPSEVPSRAPSDKTGAAYDSPTRQPGMYQFDSQPTSSEKLPTALSSSDPTGSPTGQPGISQNHSQPTSFQKPPTALSSSYPTGSPTRQPGISQRYSQPTSIEKSPTALSSSDPTGSPTQQPGISQRYSQPTSFESDEPTSLPTNDPSEWPTAVSSSDPTGAPSHEPSGPSQALPSLIPSGAPTAYPTKEPTASPTFLPTALGTASLIPSGAPTAYPTKEPTASPTFLPTALGTAIIKAPVREEITDMSQVSSPAPSEHSYPTTTAPTFGEISAEVMAHPVDGSLEYQTTVPLVVRGISSTLEPTSALVVENAIAHFLSEEVKDIQGAPVFFLKADIESQSVVSNTDGSSMALLAVKVHAIVVGRNIDKTVFHNHVELTLEQNQEELGNHLMGALSSYSESTETNKYREKNVGSTNAIFLVAVITATMITALVLGIGCFAVARKRRRDKDVCALDSQTYNAGHSGKASSEPTGSTSSQSIAQHSIAQYSTNQEATEKRSSINSQNIMKNSSHARSRSYRSSSGHSVSASYSGSGFSASKRVLLRQNTDSENVELVGIMEGNSSVTAVAKIAAITGGGETVQTAEVLCHREHDYRDDSLPLNNASSFDHSVQGNTTVLIDLMLSEAETKRKPVRWHSLGLPPRHQAFERSATAVHGPTNGQPIRRLNSAEQLYAGWQTPMTASDLELEPSDGTSSNGVSQLSSRSMMSGSTVSSGEMSNVGPHDRRNSENYEHARTRSNGSASSISSSESSGASSNSDLSSFGGSDSSADDGSSSHVCAPRDQSFLLKLKQTVSTAAFSRVTHALSASALSHKQSLPYVTKLSASNASGRPTTPAASTFGDGVASILGYQGPVQN